MNRIPISFILALIFILSADSFANDYPKRIMAPDDSENMTEGKINIRNKISPKKYEAVQKDEVYPKKIDINSGKPKNPEEIFSCQDSETVYLHEEPVCAHHVIIVNCVRAPCPLAERWVSYRTAEKACAADNIIEYAIGHCIYD